MPRVEPADITNALEETQGRVQRVETPFPGSALYAPSSGGPHPAIVSLHGSEGGDAGFTDLQAIRLAEQGFAVLAFDYYGSPGTPEKLANVDLGDTLDALRWLKGSPYVEGKKVGLYGGSRGAEQALLLASLLRNTDLVSAVGAHAPHATVVASFDPATWDAVRGMDGRPVPAWKLGDTAASPGLPIEVEDYKGPMFISHGTQDEIWGVEETEKLEARLKAAQRDDAVVRYLPGEGHSPGPAARLENEAALVEFFGRELA